MIHIGRFKQLYAVRSIEDVKHALHGLFSLLLACKAGDNAPGLGIEPHTCLRICSLAHYYAVFSDTSDESVLVPALGKGISQLCLYLLQICHIFRVLSLPRISLENGHGIVELECNECALALLAHSQAVVPVCMETCGHMVVAQMCHGEVYGTLEVVVNSALAAVGVEDHLVKECLVSALADVLDDSGEEPQSIVCTIGGMTRLLCVQGVLVVLVGMRLMTRIVVELYKGKTCAVVDLCGEHKAYLVRCPFGIEVDDALYILNGVTVAVTVSQTAVYKGSCSRPDECDKALICVPHIDHIVEGIGGSADGEAVKDVMPVGDELRYLLVGSSAVLVAGDDLICLYIVLLTQSKGQHLRFTGSQFYLGLESAAGIAVVVEHVAAPAALNAYGVAVGAVGADKAVKGAVVARYLGTGEAQEALSVVGAGGILAGIYIDVLEHLVSFKAGLGNELCVLEVYLILLVVVFGGEFAEARHRQLSRLVRAVSDLSVPDFVGLSERNIVGDLGLYPGVFRTDNGISGTVAAFALVLVQRLAHGLP